MVDYISTVHTCNGTEIARGTVLTLPSVSAEKLVVENIIADSGEIEIVAAVNGDKFNLRRVYLKNFE